MFEITRIQRDRFVLDKRLGQQSEKHQVPIFFPCSCAFLNNSFRLNRPGFFLVFANFQIFNKREVFKRRTAIHLKHFSIVLRRGAISVGDGLTLLLKNDAKLFSEPGPAI